jgi:hypothetical protein
MNTTPLTLLNGVQALLPKSSLAESFVVQMGGFLKADGNPRPEHIFGKSSSSLSGPARQVLAKTVDF